METSSTKYFLYARKSTKDREKQVLSIPSQLDALRKLVKQQNLIVVAEITEKETAHVPGRPEFDKMMRRIDAGEANGVIAWHPDRLARNSLDGGEIIYFLDAGKLIDLKFATFWFENNPQGKSNLGHAFVETKRSSDKLACDTRRGLQDKAKMGIYPSIAPRGYLNDKATKTIVVDPHLAPIVKEAFEVFSEGNKTLDNMQDFLPSAAFFPRSDSRGQIVAAVSNFTGTGYGAFSATHFTTAISNTQGSFTKESTSQSFPRNFLIRCSERWKHEPGA